MTGASRRPCVRYGLEGETPLTLEQIGERFRFTRERIRQIEWKALRKLQHPRLAGQLKDFARQAIRKAPARRHAPTHTLSPEPVRRAPCGRVESPAEIGRSPDAIYDLTLRPQNIARWFPFVTLNETESEVQLTVGAEGRRMMRTLSWRLETTWRLAELQAGAET